MGAVATGCVMGACDDAAMDEQLELPGTNDGTYDGDRQLRGGISRAEMLVLMRARPPRPPRPTAPEPKRDAAGTWTPRPYVGAVSSSQCRTLMRLARQARARNQADN